MNFLKRALLAVTRKKGKSLIMFIIFIVIANLVLAGLSIQHATEYASTLARQELGGQLTLKYDTQSAMQKARASGEQRPKIQAEPITQDMVNTVAKQKNITGYNLTVNANASAVGFTPVITQADSQENTTTSGGNTGSSTASSDSGQARGGLGANSNFVVPDVTVTGVSSSALVDTFTSGDDKIVDGRAITPEDSGKKVAIIEKNLAAQNSLNVGSTITAKATRADDTVAYTIVGIYETSAASATQGTGMRSFPFTEPYNKVFVDYTSAIPLKTVSTDTGITTGGIDSATFFVDDPKNIDTVIADSKSMNIDWTQFTLDANDQAYKQMMGPIENVASFSMTVVYIVAIAGAVILGLILMLSIKERMYETGVLLSMGEGKLKIIAQYLTEVLLIAAIAFSLSAISGKFIAQDVGNVLLNREITTVQQQAANNAGGSGNYFAMRQGGQFGGQSPSSYKAIDSLNIDVTPSEMGQMSAAGLLIILAGTMLPAAAVMRYKPKTILTKAT